MAGETTALIIFSHRSVYEEIHGPAGSRLWRPGYLAALLEKHVPVWVITPIAHASGSKPAHEIIVCDEELDGPLEKNLMPFMASIFDQNNRELKEQAHKEGLIKGGKNFWWINTSTIALGVTPDDFSDGEGEDRFHETQIIHPSSKLLELSLPIIANKCRVTVMRYPFSDLMSHDGVQWMRYWGIDVDEFVYKSAGITD